MIDNPENNQRKWRRRSLFLVPFPIMALVLFFGARVLNAQAEMAAPTAICTVPGSHATIQAAVDDTSCSEISVAAGYYTEIVTITRSVTITGAGAGLTTVNGNSQGSVFKCDSESLGDPIRTVSLADMTIQGGGAEYGGGISNGLICHLTGDNLEVMSNSAVNGGGIYNKGTMTITHSSIIGNIATNGGGIHSAGVINSFLAVSDSEVRGNYATGSGGGLYITSRAELHQVDCSENSADDAAGGIYARSPTNPSIELISISESVVRENIAAGTGGIVVENLVTIDATEIISNTGGRTQATEDTVRGGGIRIYPGGVLTLTNSTVSNNVLDPLVQTVYEFGGGINVSGNDGRLWMVNTTVSNNEPDGIMDSDDAFLYSSTAVLVIKGSDISQNIGAGIVGAGTLTVSSSRIEENTGAGIVYGYSPSSPGMVTLQHSFVENNGGFGLSGNDVTIKHSSLKDNAGYGVYGDQVYMQFSTIWGHNNPESGGGLSGETLEIRSSTIYDNHSDQDGGGIYATDNLTLVNSTISDNTADGNGGGIALVESGATASLESVTVTSNDADANRDGAGNGGGIYRDDVAADFSVLNSIIASNFDGSVPPADSHDDCSGDFVGEWSLVEVYDNAHCTGFSGATNITGQNPDTLTLADNGGPTWTQALMNDSPAIGHTPGANCLDTDQRGVERDTAGACDIGAYELGDCSAPVQLTLTIEKNGSHVQLDWDQFEANREVEIWRGSDPYTTATFELIWTNLSVDTNHTDYDAIGDLLTNNFYAVRGQNACGDYSAFSNRVGEVDFRLNPEETSGLVASAGILRYLHFAMISLPLEGEELPTTADGVATAVDPDGSVKAVARWNPLTQSWIVRRVGSPFGTPSFAVSPGDVLFLGMINPSPDSFAWVGEVPLARSIQNLLVPDRINGLIVPLDQGGEFTRTADGLAVEIGGVTHVAAWSAAQQSWYVRVLWDSGPNFPIRLGYPYVVRTTDTTPAIWP